MEYRSRPDKFATRWRVDANRPFVHRAIWSPILTTKVPRMRGASIHWPPAIADLKGLYVILAENCKAFVIGMRAGPQP